MWNTIHFILFFFHLLRTYCWRFTSHFFRFDHSSPQRWCISCLSTVFSTFFFLFVSFSFIYRQHNFQISCVLARNNLCFSSNKLIWFMLKFLLEDLRLFEILFSYFFLWIIFFCRKRCAKLEKNMANSLFEKPKVFNCTIHVIALIFSYKQFYLLHHLENSFNE